MKNQTNITLTSIQSTKAAADLCPLILQFFLFSFAGWLWEVILHIYLDGTFVNRGVLTGPWLPIYGTGGLLVLLLHRVFSLRPLPLFGCTMFLAGIMEYSTATLLETLFHKKWWDYSNLLFQIHGKVCLAGLLLFGLGGLFTAFVASPFLDSCIRRTGQKKQLLLTVFLLLIFSADVLLSLISPNTGAGITYPR